MYITGLAVGVFSLMALLILLFCTAEMNKSVKLLLCIFPCSGIWFGSHLMSVPFNEEKYKENKVQSAYFNKMGGFYIKECSALVVHEGEVINGMDNVLKCGETIIMVDARSYNNALKEYNETY